MPSVHPQAAGVAASSDGRWLAWAEPGRLVLFDLVTRSRLAQVELELEPPFELAMSVDPGRLFLLQAKGGNTLTRVYSLPSLGAVAEARRKGEARLGALFGSVAMLIGGTEALTVVDLAELRAAILPVRGAVQVLAQVSAEQVIVGSRGKLEAWNLDERRPTHRLSLALPADAGFAGVCGNGRLIWFASTGPQGTLSVFRLTDGKQLPAPLPGGVIKGIAADPASSTLVAAIQVGAEPVALVELDVERQTRRALAATPPIMAFCLTGAPVDAVAVLGERGQPTLLPLTPGTAAPAPRPPARTDAEPPPDQGSATAITPAPAPAPSGAGGGAPAPAATPTPYSTLSPATTLPPAATSAPTGDLADRLSQWRAQVQAAVVAAPPRALPPGERALRGLADEPTSRSRAELHAWGAAARARTTTTPPPPPNHGRLGELSQRFRLDVRSRTLLALLYTGWLDGEGQAGMPVALLARCLGNDEEAWVEALAQGRLGRLGWLKCRHGRTRLRGGVGRFLDEAPLRVALLAPTDLDPDAPALAPPAEPSLWRLPDGGELEAHGRELARRLREPVALIDVNARRPEARADALASRLFEARLYGALPIVVPPEPPLALAALSGPCLLISPAGGGAGPPLPAWPEPAATADGAPPAG